MDRQQLKITALSDAVGRIASESELRIADLRVQVTDLLEQLESKDREIQELRSQNVVQQEEVSPTAED